MFSYNGQRAYCQSKLANILHAKEFVTLLQVSLEEEMIAAVSFSVEVEIYFLITTIAICKSNS